MDSREFETDEAAQNLKSAALFTEAVSSIIFTDMVLCELSKVQLTLEDRISTHMYLDQSMTFP